ncbi:hypothetical protein [Vibrio splendidus]|uniref:hypothetical protein n=1 Tax=Vibrio splendidus TaxID=29497 RepID=UPI00352C083E
MEKNKNTSQVIAIGDRFFSGFGKGGNVVTSWSLAGAKHYLLGEPDINQAEDKLNKKGKETQILTVSIVK